VLLLRVMACAAADGDGLCCCLWRCFVLLLRVMVCAAAEGDSVCCC
jgi:hypothetical protein